MPTQKYDLSEFHEVDESYQGYLDRLPEKVRTRIIHQNSRFQTGIHMTAPMMCPGPEKCRIIEFCPVEDEDLETGERSHAEARLYPIGHQCIVESTFIRAKIRSLMIHFEVDPEDPVESAIISELALIDLQKHRLGMFMSKGDRDGQGLDFLRFDIKSIDPETGAVAEESKIHPAMDMLDRLEKRRERWLDRLMGTRKAQSELQARLGNLHEAQFTKELQRLSEAIENLQESPVTIEAKGRLMLGD